MPSEASPTCPGCGAPAGSGPVCEFCGAPLNRAPSAPVQAAHAPAPSSPIGADAARWDEGRPSPAVADWLKEEPRPAQPGPSQPGPLQTQPETPSTQPAYTSLPQSNGDSSRRILASCASGCLAAVIGLFGCGLVSYLVFNNTARPSILVPGVLTFGLLGGLVAGLLVFLIVFFTRRPR
jgi:hypothetical protein